MLDNKHLLKFCTFGTSLHPPAQYGLVLVIGTQLGDKLKSRLEGRGSPCCVTGLLTFLPWGCGRGGGALRRTDLCQPLRWAGVQLGRAPLETQMPSLSQEPYLPPPVS